MRKDNTNFSMIREELEKLDVIVIMPLALKDPQEVVEAEVEEDHQELKEPLLMPLKPKPQHNNKLDSK